MDDNNISLGWNPRNKTISNFDKRPLDDIELPSLNSIVSTFQVNDGADADNDNVGNKKEEELSRVLPLDSSESTLDMNIEDTCDPNIINNSNNTNTTNNINNSTNNTNTYNNNDDVNNNDDNNSNNDNIATCMDVVEVENGNSILVRSDILIVSNLAGTSLNKYIRELRQSSKSIIYHDIIDTNATTTTLLNDTTNENVLVTEAMDINHSIDDLFLEISEQKQKQHDNDSYDDDIVRYSPTDNHESNQMLLSDNDQTDDLYKDISINDDQAFQNDDLYGDLEDNYHIDSDIIHEDDSETILHNNNDNNIETIITTNTTTNDNIIIKPIEKLNKISILSEIPHNNLFNNNTTITNSIAKMSMASHASTGHTYSSIFLKSFSKIHKLFE